MEKISGLWLLLIPVVFIVGFILCAMLVRTEDPPILAIQKEPKEGKTS